MAKMATITQEDLNYLLIRDAMLEQLEANGVDNWQGYGCMCYENSEDECIFCTEDPKGFLGLKEE